MGFISNFKNTLNEYSGALNNLLSGQNQQKITEAEHYEALLHHLDSLQRQDSVLNTSKSGPGSDSVPALLSKLGTSVSRHNMVLEDLIESMEDTQKQQEAMFDQMKKLAEREENAEIATLKSSEEALFKLLEAYHDQFHIFERASRSDPSWNRQFTLFRQIIATQLQASGISVIEQTGVPVNYALHEVIDSVPTDDPALNHHVAAIYDCGYIFRGTLKRKARISAYRCSLPSGQPEENGDSVI